MTPPKLSCPQSYVIELIDKQESYSVNFNETRRRINATDVSGPVKITFVPERAVIPIGGFENVTVYATDSSGNRASCHFQVSVQATPCVDWELKPPANGELKCVPGDKGLQCSATCKNGFRFTDGATVKKFTCDVVKHWSPSSVVPDCVSESKFLQFFYLNTTFFESFFTCMCIVFCRYTTGELSRGRSSNLQSQWRRFEILPAAVSGSYVSILYESE